MKEFRRALHLALRYRWTIFGIVVSSVVVAMFWGANLGTVYPIVDVVLKGRSLRDWVDDNYEEAVSNQSELQERLQKLTRQVDSGSADVSREANELGTRLAAETTAAERFAWLRPLIHTYLPADPFRTLQLVVAGLIVGTVIKTCFLILNVVLVQRLAQLVTFDLRKRMYRHTLGLELDRVNQDGSSRILSHFTHDLQEVTKSIDTVFGRAIREPLKIIACLAGAIFICWRLLVLSLLVTPIAIFLINRLAKSVKRTSHRAMNGMADIYESLDETLNGFVLIKAFTTERRERLRFHQVSKRYMRQALKVALYNALNKPATELMSIFVVAMAILAGGYLVLYQETQLLGIPICRRPLNFGSLMTFFALLAGVSDPFRKLSEVYNEIQQGVAATDRIYERMDRPATLVEISDPLPIEQPLQTLEFQSVSFRYRADMPVLKDVSFRLSSGRTLAIVGPNGCGKSTLLSLIPRFYDPQTGTVSWNGTDVRQLRRRALRSRIAVVPQQALLFNDTVANNIAYGLARASEEQIVSAAKRAHAHEFITGKLVDGYQSIVGQQGKLLSGGQRQRIALARAILRDPELLLLDEATSQIDIASEQLIRAALADFIQGRTTVMITHRLETLRLADEILVMDAGHVVDQGDHATLLERCEVYRHLHQSELAPAA